MRRRREGAYVRIRRAMLAHEHAILHEIKTTGSYERPILASIPTLNALDRLREKGLIRYSRARRYGMGAYVLRKKKVEP